MEQLHDSDYEWILSPQMNLLEDRHIDYFSSLIERQYGFCFRQSWKIQIPDLIQPLDPSRTHIQLLHSRDGDYSENNGTDGSDHWVCCLYHHRQIYIFDSMWRVDQKAHPKWLIFLKKLYPTYSFHDNPIQFVPVQRQTNGSDCGLFAMAFAVSLAENIWPDRENVEYDTLKLRSHAVKIFKAGKIMPFPQVLKFNTSQKRNMEAEPEKLFEHKVPKFETRPKQQCKEPEFRFEQKVAGPEIRPKQKCKEPKFRAEQKMHEPGIRSSQKSEEPKFRDESKESEESNHHYRKPDIRSKPNVKDKEDDEIKGNKVHGTGPSDSHNSASNANEFFDASSVPSSRNFLLNQIRQGDRLNDEHMYRFRVMLEKVSDYKPRDTLYLNRPERIEPVLPHQKHIQILYSSNEHWICSYYDCKKIYIYDSLNLRALHQDHRIYLQHLFPHYRVNEQSVVFCRVQQQPNMNDCGIYAIAFATSVLFRQRPELIKYNHDLMRDHLCEMYETGLISHFPIVNNHNANPNLPPLDTIRMRERSASRKRKYRDSKTNLTFEKEFGTRQRKLSSENPHRHSATQTNTFEEEFRTKQRKLSSENPHRHSATETNAAGNKSEIPPCKKRSKKFDASRNKFQSKFLNARKSKGGLHTAQKVKSKYRKMENKLNNLKQSSPTEIYIRNITEKLTEGTIPEKRLEAESIIGKSLQQRRIYTRKLYQTLQILKKKADLHLSKHKTHYKTVRDQLHDLCGESRHRATGESYFYETSYIFEDLQDTVLVMNSKGQIMNILPMIPNKRNKKYWKCSQFCRIYNNQHIVKRYVTLLQTLKTQKLKSFIGFLQRLFMRTNSHLKRGHSSDCYIENRCSSIFFSTLLLLSPHFPSVRYIRDLLYRMNMLFNKLNILDNALNDSNVDLLRSITNNMFNKRNPSNIDSTGICLDEDQIKEQLKNGVLAFTARSLQVPSCICISCQKLCSPRKVVNVSKLRIPIVNPNWEKLIHHYVDNYENGMFFGKSIYEHDSICTYCLNYFRTKDLPPTCVLNNLYTGDVPEELRNLNDHEKILIQRAKAFQVVQRAGTVANKKLPHTCRIQKMKGQTFYLPLPLEETLKKICPEDDPLNKNHELYILIRSLPTTANIVWENLVNIEKVFHALVKLKEINPLYQDIKLPESAHKLFSSLPDQNIGFNITPENDIPIPDANDEKTTKAALLTQVENDHIMYARYTIQPMYDQRINASSTNLYQMLKVKDVPLNHYLQSLDLLCFPDLYPHGKNGLHGERLRRLTDAEYIKTRLCSVDPRFRLNQQYLFFLQHDAYCRQINSGIYHLLNVVNPKERFNAQQYLEKLEKGELEGRIDTIFERIRNSQQYWRIPRNNLECMVQNYGPATWFLTLSPAEWLWDDLIQYLRTVNSPYCDKLSPGELIAADPVSVARFVENKFHAMLDFILSDSHPIGNIKHYFWRREYQGRGIPHFHLILWVEDAPIIGKNSNEEIIDFINRYVTCKIPQKTVSPTLYRRVTTHQKHRHTEYCLRFRKSNKGNKTKVCRFGFSRPVTDTFVLRSPAVSIANRKKLKTKSRLYDLPRTKEEADINDYNPAILALWEGNMDIQYIGEKSGMLTTYITKYTTKDDIKNSDSKVINDINRTKPLQQSLWNIAFRSLNHREVGAIEVADTLLGHSLYGTDRDTVVKWLNVQQIRGKRVKSRTDIEKLDPKSDEIFYPSLIDDHYPERPAQLESLSLYDFAKWYEISKDEPVHKNIEYYQLSNSCYLKRRSCGYLINHYKYNPKTQPENYYYSLLLLFKPWRDTNELKGDFKTFAESFLHNKEQILEAYKYHEKLEDLQNGYEKIKEEVEELLQNEDDIQNSDDDEVLLGCDPVEAEAAMRDFHGLNTKVKDDSMDLSEMINKMNKDQLRVFETVKNAISNEERKTLRLFVSGEGGTGKSFLIEVIRRWIRSETPYDVAITAPTGLAAFNINGLTIHKLLQLPVQHGSSILKYKQLSDRALKVLREELKNVALIIIDEISMVSNLTLLFINLRLVEIFNSVDDAENGWFGGKHILVLGDLLQLPPVRSNPTYVNLTEDEMTRHVGSMGIFNIWLNLFTYDELTIKMRQKTDTRYGEILSRMRVGTLTTEDIGIIESRKLEHNDSLTYDQRLSALCEQIRRLPDDTVCLLPTCKQCNILNDRMLQQITSEEVILDALDEYNGPKMFQKKAQKLVENFDDDASETAGLLKQIKVKIGAKIMIRRNIDVTKGLVNGAIGTILSFSNFLDKPCIENIKIVLSNGDECIIERTISKIQVMDSAFIIRQQFPICLSYGMTIHKSQGLSLNNAVVDVGNSVFTSGQTYVALSRLKTLNGLHLINFDPHAIKVGIHAVQEYNRLRADYRPDLPLFEICEKKWCKTFDFLWAVEELNIHDMFHIEPIQSSSEWTIRAFTTPSDSMNYANVVIQALFNCITLRKELLMKKERNYPELASLLQVYLDQSKVIDSAEIIKSVGHPSDQSKAQGPAYFLEKLCQRDDGLSELFTHSLNISNTCTVCTYTSTYCIKQFICSIPLTALKKTNLTLEEAFTALSVRYRESGLCTKCNTLQTLLVKNELVSASSIFTLKFTDLLSDMIETKDYRIFKVPSSKIVICNNKYQVISAIFVDSSGGTKRYVNMLKGNKSEWIEVNGSNIRKCRWPTGSKNLHMLLLQRCSDGSQLQSKRNKKS